MTTVEITDKLTSLQKEIRQLTKEQKEEEIQNKKN